jgi:hypothetical protein
MGPRRSYRCADLVEVWRVHAPLAIGPLALEDLAGLPSIPPAAKGPSVPSAGMSDVAVRNQSSPELLELVERARGYLDARRADTTRVAYAR